MSGTITSPLPGTPPDSTRQVLALAAPIGFGLFPLGIALGMLVVHAGLAWWWAPVFAGVVYAGLLEFLLIGMAVAAAPLAQVALTAAVVNSRHVFYALSFPLHRVRGRLARAYSTFALTDEAYALTTGPASESWRTRQIVSLQLLLQGIWVCGATAGAVLGANLPLDRLQGLDFALTALFLVLAVDAYRSRPDPAVVVAAAACAALAWLLVPAELLPCAFAGFTGLLVLRCRLSSSWATAREGAAGA